MMRLHPFPNTDCLFSNSNTRFYTLNQPLFIYDYPNSRHKSPTFQQHSDTSRHNSLIFKPEFHHFHTQLPRFHDAITSVSEHRLPVYVLGYKVFSTKSTTFQLKFHHFHTPFRQINTQIDRFLATNMPYPNKDYSISTIFQAVERFIYGENVCGCGKNVMRRGVLMVKFGVIRHKNVEIRCRNGEILCRNAEIIAGYAEIPYCFRAFVVRFLRKLVAITAVS